MQDIMTKFPDIEQKWNSEEVEKEILKEIAKS
jgi:hypothetical protein